MPSVLHIALIPIWASFALVSVIIPQIHFLMLRSNLSNYTVLTIALAMLIFLPLLFHCEDEIFGYVMQGVSCIFFALRVCEMHTFDRTFNRKWSLAEYLEFLGTSDNGPCRILASAQEKKKRNSVSVVKVYRVHDRNLSFFGRTAVRLGITWTAFAFANAYLEKYPYHWNFRTNGWFGLLMPWDVEGVIMHVMFATQLYGLMDICYSLGTLLIVSIVSAPYTPMMDAPFFATSPRDFWSCRWNLAIKTTIHRLAFSPAMSSMRSLGIKNKMFMTAVATLAAFGFSTLLHEYALLLLIPAEAGWFENSVFFMGQGIVCVLWEVCTRKVNVQQSGGFIVVQFVGWAMTMLSLLVLCPFFVRPYATSEKFLEFPVNVQMKEFFKTVI
ncbi:hypothetical protein HDU81_004092 [Chytriomyces hyalinus]|nr:hypothetical protein HDU81_004092 [Chytriomyces hyalinus]